MRMVSAVYPLARFAERDARPMLRRRHRALDQRVRIRLDNHASTLIVGARVRAGLECLIAIQLGNRQGARP